MSTSAAGTGKRVNTYDIFVGNLPQDVDQVCSSKTALNTRKKMKKEPLVGRVIKF